MSQDTHQQCWQAFLPRNLRIDFFLLRPAWSVFWCSGQRDRNKKSFSSGSSKMHRSIHVQNNAHSWSNKYNASCKQRKFMADKKRKRNKEKLKSRTNHVFSSLTWITALTGVFSAVRSGWSAVFVRISSWVRTNWSQVSLCVCLFFLLLFLFCFLFEEMWTQSALDVGQSCSQGVFAANFCDHFLCDFRIVSWVWFCYAIFFTLKHYPEKSSFYYPFFIFYTIW